MFLLVVLITLEDVLNKIIVTLVISFRNVIMTSVRDVIMINILTVVAKTSNQLLHIMPIHPIPYILLGLLHCQLSMLVNKLHVLHTLTNDGYIRFLHVFAAHITVS